MLTFLSNIFLHFNMPRRKGAAAASSSSTTSAAVPAGLPKGTETLGIYWDVGEKLGAGAFSTVYAASRRDINDEDWVLKVSTYTEPTQSSKKSSKQRKALLAANAGANLLFWEYNVYRAYLTGVKGVPAHPKDRSWYGKSDGFAYLALERLYGGTLTSRCASHGVAAATVCKVGAQLIETLEGIHRNGLLFRDVKPDNFMLKNEDGSGRVYCLDFGAAVKYTDRDGDRKKEGTGVEGTPNFMALRVHANSPPAPADDLESLAYMLIWMLKGSLPWEGAGSMQGVVKGKEEAIMDPSVLYEGVSDSDELMAIIEYMNMVIDMDADETPDYKACKEVFYEGDIEDVTSRIGLEHTFIKEATAHNC